MKILVLAPSLRNTSPGSRFRIEQWMRYIEKEGVEFTYSGFEDADLHGLVYTQGDYLKKGWATLRAILRRLALVREIENYDAVFIYEEASRIGPALIERLIHNCGVPILYDFCDPIYLPYKSLMNGYLSYLRCFGKTKTICKLSAHVLVGNAELAVYASQFNPHVTIVPITIDLSEYSPKQWATTCSTENAAIGWSGSHSTIRHIDTIREALQELRRTRRYRLRVSGATHYELPGVDVEATSWTATGEIDFLHGCDMGIMPLPPDEWTRLRTHLKIRQYMAVGIPCVASPVGVIGEMIDDGVNGFLADSNQQWVEKLTRLIDDPVLRQRMGTKGRQTIQEHYSGEIWARDVLRIFNSVVENSRSAKQTE
jgi:glycosyltransferase involved in cell wall biosynthesis